MQKPVSIPSGVSPAGRHIALLIDADNVSHSKIAGILSELSKYGTPNIRRAYGDWTSKQLTGWTGVFPTGLTLSALSFAVLVLTAFLGLRLAYVHERGGRS